MKKTILSEALPTYDINAFIPTEDDCLFVLKCKKYYNDTAADRAAHPNDYASGSANKHKEAFKYLPWFVAFRLKRANQIETIIKYFLIAAIIEFTELTDQLVRTCKNMTVTKADIDLLVNDQVFMNALLKIINKTLATSVTESLTESIEKHDSLNPKLFDGKKLKREVKEKVLEIVDEFTNELDQDGVKIKIKDIILIGSNVSYNYTKDSDLDLHIIADTSSLVCPDNLYPALYSAYRSIFNKKFDIDFYGIPVEIFVEAEETATVSNGIYSVKSNKWIKEPEEQAIPEIDQDEFKKEYANWEDKYKKLIDSKDKLKDETKVVEFIEEVYNLRKVGIRDEGEYSTGNLIFKELRNTGKLDKLKDLKNVLVSKRLSLEEDLINNKNREEARVKITRIAGTQPIIQQNGVFQLYNIKENEVDNIIRQLQKLPEVEKVTRGAPGKFDFSHMNPAKLPTRLYSITGKLVATKLKENMDMSANGYLIHNAPQYAKTKKYIIASLVDDELWFYGAWDSYEVATECLNDLDSCSSTIHWLIENK